MSNITKPCNQAWGIQMAIKVCLFEYLECVEGRDDGYGWKRFMLIHAS